MVDVPDVNAALRAGRTAVSRPLTAGQDVIGALRRAAGRPVAAFAEDPELEALAQLRSGDPSRYFALAADVRASIDAYLVDKAAADLGGDAA